MNYREIDRRVTEQVLKNCNGHENRTHAENVKRIGSVMTLLTAIAWRRYRLFEDSPTIASALRIHAVSIRQTLFRLNEVARRLGFDTFERHASADQISRTLEQLWKDPEYRARMRQAHKGHRHSKATRARMAAAHVGRKFSSETRARMRRAARRRWADPKYRAHCVRAMRRA
jgi:hypothetical protein